MNEETISCLIKEKVDLKIFDTISSTNTYLNELAKDGLRKNTAVIAREQTKGRGRQGRDFFSPVGGLYLSALVMPQGLKAEDGWKLTTSAAVSVCRAIENVCSKEARIKWVNDIFLDGKKVCGILCETVYAEEINYAVIGIGINIYCRKDFPDEIKDTAGALYDRQPDEEVYESLAGEILNGVYAESFMQSYQEYKKRQLAVGKQVTVLKGKDAYSATVTGLDDRCRLKIIDGNGRAQILSSGEIRIKV